MTIERFFFQSYFCDPTKVYYARIGSEIFSPEQLFQALFWGLSLPGYFGFNWNALYDCLTDLSWIREREVVIVHDHLPRLEDSDLSIYIEILRDAIKSWGNNSGHLISVVFPESEKIKILSHLGLSQNQVLSS